MKEFPQPTTKNILKRGAIIFFSTLAIILLVMFLSLRKEEGEFLKTITLLAPIMIPVFLAIIGIPILIVIILNKKRPDIIKNFAFANVKKTLEQMLIMQKSLINLGIVFIAIGLINLLFPRLKFISNILGLLPLNEYQPLYLIIIGSIFILLGIYFKKTHIPKFKKKFEIEEENKK